MVIWLEIILIIILFTFIFANPESWQEAYWLEESDGFPLWLTCIFGGFWLFVLYDWWRG